MHRTGLGFLIFLGALFLGGIVIPTLLVTLIPALSPFMFGYTVPFLGTTFSLVGFAISGAFAFPILVYANRSAHISG